MNRSLIVVAVAAAAGSAHASTLPLNFTSAPTIESTPGSTLVPHGSNPNFVIGSGIDGMDVVRYAGVAQDGLGNGIDALVTIVDAQNRNRVIFGSARNTWDGSQMVPNGLFFDLSNSVGRGSSAGLAPDPETGLAPVQGVTSARLRIEFVTSGTSDLIAPTNIGLTVYDIDGVSEGRASRFRTDGVTLRDVDSWAVDVSNVLDVTQSGGNVTARPVDGLRSVGDEGLITNSIQGSWNSVNTVELDWFFDWTRPGTRGLTLGGQVELFTDPVPAPGATALAAAGLAIGARRRRRA